MAATQVIRAGQDDPSPEAANAEAIALALMGVGDLSATRLAEGATWDRGEGAVTGREAILAARAAHPVPEKVWIDQVVTHGRAGSVAGRLTRPGGRPRLYCHLIRFTSASAQQVAGLISFEHAGGN